jgi:phosphopantetheine--protein transferase-like protein
MITGIGIDIVDRTRFDNVSDKQRFLEQLFTNKELQAVPAHRAACFAVKEAVMKAFCVGLHLGSHWHDIEIHKAGQVMLSGIFTDNLKESTIVRATHCSSKHHALGFVLAQE